MKRLRAAPVLVLVLLWSPIAYAESGFGNLHGFTRSAAGSPLAGVQVVIHSLDESTDRTVVSGDHGAFTADHLAPGRYQLTANKSGFASLSPTAVELAPQQSLRLDLILGSPSGPKESGDHVLASDLRGLSTAAKPDDPPLSEREKQLLGRIERLEQRLAALEAKEAKGAPAAVAANQPEPAHPQMGTATAAALVIPAKAEAQPAGPAVPSAQPVLVASLGKAASLGAPGKPAALSAAPTVDTATAPQTPAKIEPFSDADWTWLNGNPRTKDIYWDTKFFTPEIRADMNYTHDFNNPTDHSVGGSSEIFRSNEVQVTQLGVGGDFHYDHARGRLMTQFGM